MWGFLTARLSAAVYTIIHPFCIIQDYRKHHFSTPTGRSPLPFAGTVPAGAKRPHLLHEDTSRPAKRIRKAAPISPRAASEASSVLSFDTVSTRTWATTLDGAGFLRDYDRRRPARYIRKRSPAREQAERERRWALRREKKSLRRHKSSHLHPEPIFIATKTQRMEVKQLKAAIAKDFGFGEAWVNEEEEGGAEVIKKEEAEEQQIDEEIQARKAAKVQLRRSLLDSINGKSEAELADRKRMRILKAKKKKRLAALRKEEERRLAEKEFLQAKEAYIKEFENLGAGLQQFSIDDGPGGRVDKYGRLLPPVKKVEKKKFIAALSSDWESKVTAALAHKSETTVVAKTLEGVDLSRRDIDTVVDTRRPHRMPWLNDEIVNGFYANLCARANEQAGYVKGPNNTPRFTAYSTAWLTTVRSKGVTSIQGWSRRKGIKGEKLLKCERIFMPCNSGAHWTLLAISGTKKTIEYLDSMDHYGWTNKKMIGLAMAWLKMELGAKFIEKEWSVLEAKTSIQNNTDDCGVFTCFNGWALAKGFDDPSVEFGASDMILARRVLIAVLLNGGFTGDFDL